MLSSLKTHIWNIFKLILRKHVSYSLWTSNLTKRCLMGAIFHATFDTVRGDQIIVSTSYWKQSLRHDWQWGQGLGWHRYLTCALGVTDPVHSLYLISHKNQKLHGLLPFDSAIWGFLWGKIYNAIVKSQRIANLTESEDRHSGRRTKTNIKQSVCSLP